MALSSVRATHSASKRVAATCTNPSRVDRALSNRAAPAARRNKVLALGSVPVADSDINRTSGNTEEKRPAVYRQRYWCARPDCQLCLFAAERSGLKQQTPMPIQKTSVR